MNYYNAILSKASGFSAEDAHELKLILEEFCRVEKGIVIWLKICYYISTVK